MNHSLLMIHVLTTRMQKQYQLLRNNTVLALLVIMLLLLTLPIGATHNLEIESRTHRKEEV